MEIVKRKIAGQYLFILYLLTTIIILSAGSALADNQMIASLTAFSGQVMIKSKGQWGVDPRENLPLFSLDKVVTRAGRATITFLDGAVLELRPNSNLMIQETEEGDPSTKTKIVKRKLRLLLGKFLFRTGKLKDRTVIQTPTAVCGLRGTELILSTDAAGLTYIQFIEGGTSYTLGDFITGVAQDIPAEIADLNPAQKAVLIAYAAAQQAKQAQIQAEAGEITNDAALLKSAEAAEAAAREAKAAAEAMLNNPDPEIQAEARMAVIAAEKAIKAAQEAQEAIKKRMGESGETVPLGDAEAYTDSGGNGPPQFPDTFPNPPTPPYIPPETNGEPPPTINIVYAPEPNTNQDFVSFEFTVDQNSKAYYRLDGGDPVPLSEDLGQSFSFYLPYMPEGDHQILITVTSPNGQSSTSYNWTNDYTDPVFTTQNAPQGSTTNTNNYNIDFVAQDAYGVTYAYSLDDGETWTETGNAFAPPPFIDGESNLLVRVVDPAGNTTLSNAFSWFTDNTVPIFTVENAPVGAPTNTNNFNIDFQANDITGLTYAYSLDDGETWTETGSSFVSPNFVDGKTSFLVRATDEAGNEAFSNSFWWVTDNTSPMNLAMQDPSVSPEFISFSLQSDDANEVTYDWQLRDNDLQVVGQGTVGDDGVLNIADLGNLDLPAGDYSLVWTAIDEANNSTPGEEILFTLNKHSLDGIIAGSGSFIEGIAIGNVSVVDNPGWTSGYFNTFDGTSDHTSSPWQAVAGGEIWENEQLNGYWIERITGDGGTGTSALSYLTDRVLGAGIGDVIANFNGETWSATDRGTVTETPLTFGSDFSGANGSNTGYLSRLFSGTHYSHDFDRWTYGEGWVPDGNEYDFNYFVADNYYDFQTNPPNPANNVVLFAIQEYEDFNSESTEIYLPLSSIYGRGRWISGGSLQNGPFIVTDSDYWDIGSLTEAGLFSPIQNPSLYTEWRRSYYAETEANGLAHNGTFSGRLGGTGDLWSPNAGIYMLGAYNPWDGNYNQSSLFSVGTWSSPITTGGSYYASLSGVIHDNTIYGGFNSVFIKDDGSAGVHYGLYQGTAYSEIGKWDASGSITPISMAFETGLTPADLEDNLQSEVLIGWVGGDFGTPGSYIENEFGFGYTHSLKGYDKWGTFGVALGGQNYYYNPQNSNTFTARIGGIGIFGRGGGYEDIYFMDQGFFLSDLIQGTAENGLITASPLSGKILTLTKFIDSPDVNGYLFGSYNTIDQTWQANAGGYWQNGQALAFNGVFDGDVKRAGKWQTGYATTYEPDWVYFRYDYNEVTNSAYVYQEDDSGNEGTGIMINRTYLPNGTYQEWSQDYNGGNVTSNQGTWSDDLLADLVLEAQNYDFYYNSFDDVEYEPDPRFQTTNGFHGSLGSLDNLWTASVETPAELIMLGEYFVDLPGSQPGGVFSVAVMPYNPFGETYTIWDGDHSNIGTYYGYLGGRTLEGSILIDSHFLALYLDDLGNIGFLKGGSNGEAFSDVEMFEASGWVYPIELVQDTGLSPYTFVDNLIANEINFNDYLYCGGAFFDTGLEQYGGSIELQYVQSSEVGLSGIQGNTPYYLGVKSSLFSGNYVPYGPGETTLDSWALLSDHSDQYGQARSYYLSIPLEDIPGKWSDGEIAGKEYGAWASWQTAITGISGSDVKGAFDPVTHTWQASVMQAKLDTNTFLSLAEDPNEIALGPNSKLAQLNIPYIEVGRANFSGGNEFNNGWMTVELNNVNFFAYSDGGQARVWATNNVSGSYGLSSGTAVGWNMNLWGSEPEGHPIPANLNAQFTVQSWDSVNNKWGASIDGGTGTVNNKTITFSGAAAGNIDPNNSQISGTASGTASAPLPQQRE